ncbi:Uncharacterised protein [Mycobacterium tuberculosis]|uniref:Uncharacterized protein n=1 Tax=Mycobacterium tuberculosis TaxID=1773 RepID=A0A916LFH3_MYCTX|nr:Uncharacterised protein [Mycobacterium tuberculosis]
MHKGHAGDVAAQQQRTHSWRATEFVPGHAHRRQPAGPEVKRELSHRLNGITVHRHAEFHGDN